MKKNHRNKEQQQNSLIASRIEQASTPEEIFNIIDEALDDNSSLSGYYQLTIDRMHEVMVNLYRYAEFASMAYEDLFNAFTEKEKLRQIFRA